MASAQIRTRFCDLEGDALRETATIPPIEIEFFKSSYSSDSWNCVEVGVHDTRVVVRDSKNVDGPVLRYGHAAWADFVSAIRTDDFAPPTGA